MNHVHIRTCMMLNLDCSNVDLNLATYMYVLNLVHLFRVVQLYRAVLYLQLYVYYSKFRRLHFTKFSTACAQAVHVHSRSSCTCTSTCTGTSMYTAVAACMNRGSFSSSHALFSAAVYTQLPVYGCVHARVQLEH